MRTSLANAVRHYCILRWFLALSCFAIVTACQVSLAEKPLGPHPQIATGLAPFLNSFCIDCHSGDAPDAGLSLSKMLAAPEFNSNRKRWKKIVQQLRAGNMPPEDVDQPSEEKRSQAVAWLERELSLFDCNGPRNPGRVTIRRLNRIEYRNTVRDLLGVKYNPSKTFPRDELGYGFDNNGDVLSLSPLLLEKYLDAAEVIASQAVQSPESISEPVVPAIGENAKQSHIVRPLYMDGRVTNRFRIPTTGKYILRVNLSATQAGDELARAKLFASDREVGEVEIAAIAGDPESFSVLVVLEKGSQKLSVAFVNDYWDPTFPDPEQRDRNMAVHSIECLGPVDEIFGNTKGNGRLFARTSYPSNLQWKSDFGWRHPARQMLKPLLVRAHRRPVRPGEVDKLLHVMAASHGRGASFQRALQLSVEAVLVSPQFLFRGELEKPSHSTNKVYAINEFELASRLSYFIWSTMPDDELLRLANQGKLRENLTDQVRRLLRDKKSGELVRNFGGQWLGTRQLVDTHPHRETFPEFDDSLRKAMRKETELFLTEIVQKDLPLSTLINADFTFLNARLAKHYGQEGVEGKQFRRVKVLPERGAGVLTHASVLTVTSHPDRTSPVRRGKWILTQILGEEPPPPPPSVGDLPEDAASLKLASVRERLKAHRADPSCNACHQYLDPPGFSLENYDAIGRYRTHEKGQPVDSTGELPNGRKFQGANGLRDLLLEKQEAFTHSVAEKMLTYALGRGLEYYDQCAVNDISKQTMENENRFSALVLAIVKSDPFQKRNYESE